MPDVQLKSLTLIEHSLVWASMVNQNLFVLKSTLSLMLEYILKKIHSIQSYI